MEKNKKLDGVWNNEVFKVKIKEDTYVSYYNNFRYGKGKIIYDNENFTLTSTYACLIFSLKIPWLFLWIPFVEVVEGKFTRINDKALTVSSIEGRYCDYNGTWMRVKK